MRPVPAKGRAEVGKITDAEGAAARAASTLQSKANLSTIFLVLRVAKIVVAMLCIVCVLALCIAPYVDIPFTVLKALQDVLLLILALLVCALLLASLFHQVLTRYTLVRWHNPDFMRSMLPPLETNCVQQC